MPVTTQDAQNYQDNVAVEVARMWISHNEQDIDQSLLQTKYFVEYFPTDKAALNATISILKEQYEPLGWEVIKLETRHGYQIAIREHHTTYFIASTIFAITLGILFHYFTRN